MPKLFQGHRIWACKVKNADINLFNLREILVFAINFLDFVLGYDYNLGDIFLLDFTGLSLAHVLKMEPSLLLKYMEMYEGAFSVRISGIHYVNAPPFIDIFLKIIKTVLKPKLIDRVLFTFILRMNVIQKIY